MDRPGQGLAGFPGTPLPGGSGIDFDHVKGSAGDYFLIETMAAGGGGADFDGDGHLDLYLVNGFDLGAIHSRLTSREQGGGHLVDARAMEARGSAPADPDSYAVQLAPAAGVQGLEEEAPRIRGILNMIRREELFNGYIEELRVQYAGEVRIDEAALSRIRLPGEG